MKKKHKNGRACVIGIILALSDNQVLSGKKYVYEPMFAKELYEAYLKKSPGYHVSRKTFNVILQELHELSVLEKAKLNRKAKLKTKGKKRMYVKYSLNPRLSAAYYSRFRNTLTNMEESIKTTLSNPEAINEELMIFHYCRKEDQGHFDNLRAMFAYRLIHEGLEQLKEIYLKENGGDPNKCPDFLVLSQVRPSDSAQDMYYKNSKSNLYRASDGKPFEDLFSPVINEIRQLSKELDDDDVWVPVLLSPRDTV